MLGGSQFDFAGGDPEDGARNGPMRLRIRGYRPRQRGSANRQRGTKLQPGGRGCSARDRPGEKNQVRTRLGSEPSVPHMATASETRLLPLFGVGPYRPNWRIRCKTQPSTPAGGCAMPSTAAVELPPARGNPALYGKYVIGAAGLGTLLTVELVAQH
jgi:hypothetical protein